VQGDIRQRDPAARRDGLLRTILRMWGFRLRYWLGADPAQLARSYYG